MDDDASFSLLGEKLLIMKMVHSPPGKLYCYYYLIVVCVAPTCCPVDAFSGCCRTTSSVLLLDFGKYQYGDGEVSCSLPLPPQKEILYNRGIHIARSQGHKVTTFFIARERCGARTQHVVSAC